MGKPGGFLEYARREPARRPVSQRVRDYAQIEQPLSLEEIRLQAARCMDCGLPFCHGAGCPLESLMPDWNDMVYRGQWKRALDLLCSTNPFPEITGRVCPAPCEAACTLSLNQEAVAIRHIELQIAERGWDEGWMLPQRAAQRTHRRAAVIGSGPAGLAAAQRLVRAGHEVVVFEKDDAIGGVLRHGIPEFKLEKRVLDRRLDQMRGEGVAFETGVAVGADISARYLQRTFDGVLLAVGCRVPRDLAIPGRELDGIWFAMDFLAQQNRVNGGLLVPEGERLSAAGRHTVVIGGGDTGADCVGTARRQGAASIRQIELLPQPPAARAEDNPWPAWPDVLRVSTSHEEGCERRWSVLTKEFLGEHGRVTGLRCAELEWSPPDESGRRTFREVPGSQFDLEADVVLLALGFVHCDAEPLARELGLQVDARGNLAAGPDSATAVPGVFAAGDCVSGSSLVVRAIAAGSRAAEAMDAYLRGRR
jgi:glutamate synthase (NADPH/NADH) small chain